MPKTREQLNRIKNLRRDSILDAAAEIFCRNGFEFSTIDQIAKLAECSHGLLYHYFRTKEEIFFALIEYAIARTAELMRTILPQEGSPSVRLRRFLDGVVSAIGEHDRYVYYLYFLTSLHIVKRDFLQNDAEKLAGNKEHPNFHLAALIAEGQKSGEIRSDATPDEYAQLLWAILQGYIMFTFTSKSVRPDCRVTLPNRKLLLRIFFDDIGEKA